jgi:hypothetical protein
MYHVEISSHYNSRTLTDCVSVRTLLAFYADITLHDRPRRILEKSFAVSKVQISCTIVESLQLAVNWKVVLPLIIQPNADQQNTLGTLVAGLNDTAG